MKQQKFYYKLVRKSIENSDIWNSSNNILSEDINCVYKLNKTTYPKVGKLFVFNSILNLKKFAVGFDNTMEIILKVEVINPIILEKVLFPHLTNDTSILTNFWNNFQKTATIQVTVPPSGTYLVDSITPVEVIPYN